MSVAVIIVILFLHFVLGGIQIAFDGDVPGCDGNQDPFCGTPIQGFKPWARSTSPNGSREA